MSKRLVLICLAYALGVIGLSVRVDAQTLDPRIVAAPCPVDSCVTADPIYDVDLDYWGLVSSEPSVCSPPISCYPSNTGASGGAVGGDPLRIAPAYTNFAPSGCAPTDTACLNAYAKNKDNFRRALANLNRAISSFPVNSPEYLRLSDAYRAYTQLGTVTIMFGSLAGTAAALTTPSGDGQSFTVTLDMSKIGTDAGLFAVDVAHEGTHIYDFMRPPAQLETMNLFQIEYRGYDTSSLVAQGFGLSKLTMSTGIVIWDSTWPAASQATLRDQAVTAQVVKLYGSQSGYEVVTPHDPFPNQ